MKFGQQLRTKRLPKWTNRYIAYSTLKGVIKQTREHMEKEGRQNPTPKQIQMFMDRIRSEMKKVDSFLSAKLQQMEVRKKVISNRISELESLPKSARSASEISLEQAIDIVEQELTNLRNFCDLNREGFAKIAKKYDKQCPGGNLKEFTISIVSRFEDNSQVDGLLQWCSESRKSLHETDGPRSMVLTDLLRSIALHSSSEGVRQSSSALKIEVQEMFFHAVEQNNVPAVKELLQYVKNLDAMDSEGNTALLLACDNGFPEMANILIQGGANVSAVGRLDRTALHTAVIARSVECVEILIKANAELNCKDMELHCPIHYAAMADDPAIVKVLIDAGAKLSVRDMEGNPALAVAARNGSAAAMAILIDSGARVDGFNWYSQVPLHFAARRGSLAAVQLLLEFGSKPDSYDVTGRSPVYEASRHGHADVLKALIESCRKGSEDLLQIVLSAPDIEGLTPLHTAAYHGHTKCVEVLLGQGVNREPTDQLGWTPRDYALYCGHLELAELFPTPPVDSVQPPDLNQNLLNPKKRQASVYYEPTPDSFQIVIRDEQADGIVSTQNDKIVSGHQDLVRITFRVRARVQSERYLCICGDTPDFGSWDPAHAVPLIEDMHAVNIGVPADFIDSTEEALSTWTVTVLHPRDQRIEYKYLIKYEDVLEVWEVLPNNRVFEPTTHSIHVIDDGVFGYQDGESWTSQGWLVADYQLHVRLGHVTASEYRPPVRLFGPETPDMIQIGHMVGGKKVTREIPLPMHDKMETVRFQLRVHKDGQLPQFCIFFNVFCGKGFRIGSGSVMSSCLLRDYEGHYTIPLISDINRGPVGECNFEFLVARPFLHKNMKTVLGRSFSKSTKIIGHRGSGATRYLSNQPQQSLRTQENTILSFVTAAALGAEYIEFDVQLTMDLVPIIYHDWAFHLHRMPGVPPIPVSSITLQQFYELRNLARERGSRTVDDLDLHHRRRKMSVNAHSIANEIRDKFPLLKDCFTQVPASVGFNIELKYPPDITRAEIGCKFASRNDYVDAVLKVVFDHAGSRRIMFSSFDPDICTLASLKQPSYPVFFLTEAGSSPCWDPRGQSLRDAVRFAKRQNLVGIVSFADPLLKSPKLITTVKAAGLVLATWSSANNDPVNQEISHRFGIDAVVIDKIAYVDKENPIDGSVPFQIKRRTDPFL